jgi:hypothetical protein
MTALPLPRAAGALAVPPDPVTVVLRDQRNDG